MRDPLRELLIDFFSLPPETSTAGLQQQEILAWDSLAMVQLIGELQAAFGVDFELDEIERLRTYDEIRDALASKGVCVPS